MKSLTWCIGTLLLVFLTSGSVRADAKDEITKLSQAIDDAVKAHDAKALDAIYAADGQFVLPDGRLVDKRTRIAQATDKKYTFDTSRSVIAAIQVFGNTAVETGTWTGVGTTEGKPFRMRERYTCVWVKKGESWVAKAEHCTTIPDGPETAKPGRKPTEAFREWGDYMVGGVWTTTNAKGSKEEVRFERILDKSFIRGTWKSGDETREDVYGIDPATGRWTFWGIGSKGEVYTGVAESEKPGEWTYRGAGRGKNGAISFRNKDVKLGADKDRFEMQEYVWDGKKAPAEVQVWTRKK